MILPRTAVVAEPQPIFRAGLAEALRRSGIEVVAETADVPAAVGLSQQLVPGVCVLDGGRTNGVVAATRRIVDVAPATLVVVLGTPGDDDAMLAAVRAGASGYLARNTSTAGLVRAVDAVLRGGAAIPRGGVAALLRELRSRDHRRARVNGVALTAREAAAVELLVGGLGTHEIAAELGVSPVTVRRYLASAARKVGAADRAALVRALGG